MTAYPANIKYLDAATFTETSEDPAIAQSKMEGGYVISRPRFTRRPRRSFSFSYDDMGDADKAILVTFWNTVMGSSNAFTWTHPATGETLNARFSSETKMNFQRFGYGSNNRWKSDKIVIVEV